MGETEGFYADKPVKLTNISACLRNCFALSMYSVIKS